MLLACPDHLTLAGLAAFLARELRERPGRNYDPFAIEDTPVTRWLRASGYPAAIADFATWSVVEGEAEPAIRLPAGVEWLELQQPYTWAALEARALARLEKAQPCA